LLFSGEKYPFFTISNNKISVKVYIPDRENGFYRGCRFDWSGIVGKVKYGKHTFFGKWLTPYNPENPNGAMSTAEEYGMGAFEMPSPLGFYEAKEGEGFIKIGVGVLKKEGKKYFFGKDYKFLKYGNWNVRKGIDFVEFRQKLSYGKYGYEYTKKIQIVGEKSEFYIWHKLKNTGLLPIIQTVYCHNFTIIDDIPIGPSYTVNFSFPIKAKSSLRDVAEVEKNKIVFLKSMVGEKALFTEIEGNKGRVKENYFIVFNKKAGVGVEVKGSLPLYQFNFYAVSTAVCPEPYVKIHINSGEEISWKNTYKFFEK